jgi:SAM-dependent MidA family methyltransferase
MTSLKQSMDTYMLDHQLLNFMQQVLEGTDQSFYQNNTDIANDFFTGPATGLPTVCH